MEKLPEEPREDYQLAKDIARFVRSRLNDHGITNDQFHEWLRTIGIELWMRGYVWPWVSRIRSDVMQGASSEHFDGCCPRCGFVYIGPREAAPIKCPFDSTELVDRSAEVGKWHQAQRDAGLPVPGEEAAA